MVLAMICMRTALPIMLMFTMFIVYNSLLYMLIIQDVLILNLVVLLGVSHG